MRSIGTSHGVKPPLFAPIAYPQIVLLTTFRRQYLCFTLPRSCCENSIAGFLPPIPVMYAVHRQLEYANNWVAIGLRLDVVSNGLAALQMCQNVIIAPGTTFS